MEDWACQKCPYQSMDQPIKKGNLHENPQPCAENVSGTNVKWSCDLRADWSEGWTSMKPEVKGRLP